MEKAMMRMSLSKAAIATAAFGCAALFSFSWSGQDGASLSIDSAQARVGRPGTPMSVAGVARRQDRRAGLTYGGGRYYGSSNNRGGLVGGADNGTYSPGVVGAGLAGAAAVGTAAAVAATRPWGWGGYYGGGYYGGGPYAAYGGGPYVGTGALAANAYYSGGYGTYNAGPSCMPGALYIASDGLVQMCK